MQICSVTGQRTRGCFTELKISSKTSLCLRLCIIYRKVALFFIPQYCQNEVQHINNNYLTQLTEEHRVVFVCVDLSLLVFVLITFLKDDSALSPMTKGQLTIFHVDVSVMSTVSH